MMKRRDALKTIGTLAGAAGLTRLLPACGDDDGPVGITTYVYLMLENRSYDHVLGGRTLEGLGGDGLTAAMNNPDAAGNPVAPYAPSDLEMCTQGDPPHGWDPSHRQWNNGANDGFVREHQRGQPGARDPMQYLSRPQQPVTWALADAYTSCDRWFCSVMGPTLPNRAYWHAGTSFGLNVNNDILTTFSNGVPIPTIYNRLADKGVDWAYYFGNLAVVSLLGSSGPYSLDLGANDGTGHVRRSRTSGPGRPVLQGCGGRPAAARDLHRSELLRERRPPAGPPDPRAGADRGGLHRAGDLAAVEELHAGRHVRRARRVLRSRTAADDDRRHAGAVRRARVRAARLPRPDDRRRSVRQAGPRQLGPVRPLLRAPPHGQHVRHGVATSGASPSRTTSPTAST